LKNANFDLMKIWSLDHSPFNLSALLMLNCYIWNDSFASWWLLFKTIQENLHLVLIVIIYLGEVSWYKKSQQFMKATLFLSFNWVKCILPNQMCWDSEKLEFFNFWISRQFLRSILSLLYITLITIEKNLKYC
jgi:hypothetical protein